jgi:hypothetical protein
MAPRFKAERSWLTSLKSAHVVKAAEGAVDSEAETVRADMVVAAVVMAEVTAEVVTVEAVGNARI